MYKLLIEDNNYNKIEYEFNDWKILTNVLELLTENDSKEYKYTITKLFTGNDTCEYAPMKEDDF